MKKILSISIIIFISLLNAQGITNTLGGNSANDRFFVENQNRSKILTVTGDGRVGIGTSSPERQFHIDAGATGDADAVIGLTSASSFDWSLGIDNNDLGKFKIANAVSDNPLRDYPLMTITTNGNVGIGIGSPESKLSVGGIGNSTIGIYAEGSGRGVYSKATDNNGEGIHSDAHGELGIGVYGSSFGSSGTGVKGWATGGKGVVGQGGTYDFDAVGTGVNYGATSSIRWKNNVVEIDNPLEKLAEIRGVYFDWDEEHGGKHDVGCIAEEIGKVLPEIVVYEENGIDADGMDYSKLTPLLVEVAKAQQKLIKELTKRIEELENN